MFFFATLRKPIICFYNIKGGWGAIICSKISKKYVRAEKIMENMYFLESVELKLLLHITITLLFN